MHIVSPFYANQIPFYNRRNKIINERFHSCCGNNVCVSSCSSEPWESVLEMGAVNVEITLSLETRLIWSDELVRLNLDVLKKRQMERKLTSVCPSNIGDHS